jgi:4-hydroxybenzoate polyprenyltransferase
MRRKDYVYGMKPFNWIKGSVLTFIGLIISRENVGVGRLGINIYYGLPIYFLIASSVMLLTVLFKIGESAEERKYPASKKLMISSAVLYIMAFGTSIFHTIYYNLEIINIFLLAFIGIIWVISIFYAKTWKYKNELTNLLISLSSSFGIFYGASLNGLPIPISIFVFFGAVFLLQFSKDLMNESKNKEKYKEAGAESLVNTLGEERTQKISFILDIVIIFLILLPIIPDFIEILGLILYMIPTIFSVIFVGVAALLTFLMKSDKTYFRIIKILLRFGMFFLFTASLLATF